jgi:hypothetical protein
MLSKKVCVMLLILLVLIIAAVLLSACASGQPGQIGKGLGQEVRKTITDFAQGLAQGCSGGLIAPLTLLGLVALSRRWRKN